MLSMVIVWVAMKERNKELAKSIGRAARAARDALGITQEVAADRVQLSVEFYARIERGNSMPSVPTLARLATVLKVSADIMLDISPLLASAVVVAAAEADATQEYMIVRPTDLPVRHPLTRNMLAADGEQVPRNAYWEWRLKDGAVEIVEPKS